MKNTLVFDWKLMILVGHLSILIGFLSCVLLVIISVYKVGVAGYGRGLPCWLLAVVEEEEEEEEGEGEGEGGRTGGVWVGSEQRKAQRFLSIFGLGEGLLLAHRSIS